MSIKKLKIPMPMGYVAPGFEEVLTAFKEGFTNGHDKGSSFAAYYKGKLVVNLWGGVADIQVKRPWKEDTMAFFHSCTKFAGAVTIAHLIDRGAISYTQKISSLWPEFAQNGKENITVEMLLSYRAGLSALDEPFFLNWMLEDPQKMSEVLAKQKPYWPPGETHGYHPITMGLYLDQIVQRVDTKKRSLANYFREEIAVPFGIDFYIGLPKSLYYRAARLEPQPLDQQYMTQLIATLPDANLYQRAFTQTLDWNSSRKLSDPDFLEIPCSSTHGVGTAAGMAKFAGILANGGELDGKQLLSPEIIAKLQEPLCHGIDLATSSNEIYGRGTMLQPIVEGKEHWFTFGHSGYGDQNTVSDFKYKVGWAYVTNHLDPLVSFTKKHKWQPVADALFDCVYKLEGVQETRKWLSTHEELQRELGKSKL